MLNQLPVLSSVRQPRCVVWIKSGTLGWQLLQGWIEVEVEENSYAAADTFRIVIAASGLAKASASLDVATIDANWFSSQSYIEVEIYAGFPANPESFAISELASLIVGVVDTVEFSPVDGLIHLSGRDKTGLLIDTKTALQYRSQKSSQIAKLFAAEHGMTAVVTATTKRVGNYYAQHSDTLTTSKSEWDILSELAKKEGFACYVKGNELHFEPRSTENSEPYVVRWEPPNTERASPLFNGTAVSFERKLTIAKGVSVVVKSASLTSKTPVIAVYPKVQSTSVAAGKAGQAKANMQIFEIEVKAGTSKADALKFAQARYHEIIAHEMKMTVAMPGDNLLSTRNPLKMEGTGTDYDQVYFPDCITRKLGIRNGYTMHVTAKNRSPNNPV